MGTYRIHPAGVQSTLTATGADAEEFGTLLKSLPGAVESAASGTGNSGAIAPALGEFFAVQEKRVKGMATRMTSCLTGAADATKAYVKGDLEMAATYQANAARAAAGQPPR